MPSRRTPSSILALVSLLAGFGALLAGCDEGPSGPTHFSIVSPGESQVTVLPGETVHFEVLLNATGFRVEYLIDGEEVHQGPTLDFQPILVEHTVRVSVIPEGSTAAPDVREFTVGVEVPGNAPPTVTSFDHSPEIAEALRDTFVFTLRASDSDGSVSRVVIDYGDGSAPTNLTGGGLSAGQVMEGHVFPAAGTYVAQAIVYDDDNVAVAIRDTIQAIPPNQLPTGSLAVVGPTEGDAPVTVSLQTSGNDVDGQVVEWELDTDLGDGFVPIQPRQTVQVSYPYRGEPYRPRLRLTDDDGDSSVIEAEAEILVFRQIDVGQSSVSWQGNPQLSGSGRLFIRADGQDALTVTATVRGPDGSPLADVPVRIKSLRNPLVAPDGTNLGSMELIVPETNETGSNGEATVSLTSNVSTRLEAVPEVNSTPFEVLVEASRGHGEWVELSRVQNVETETTVSLQGGSVIVTKPGGIGYCPGELVEIHVHAENRSGGPARGKYTEIRYGQFVNQVWFGAVPGAGYGDWRTDGNGNIVFRYHPTEDDDDRVIAAWVDGNRLSVIGAFNFKVDC